MSAVADPCIWHDGGTNLSRRPIATTAGAPTDHACVYLAEPPLASATLLGYQGYRQEMVFRSSPRLTAANTMR
jgi:hypothetical protein